MADQLANPQQRALALQSLTLNPGWQFYVARHEAIVKQQLEAKVWDTATTDEERRVLVAARKLLVDSFSPGKLVEAALTQALTEARQAEKSR